MKMSWSKISIQIVCKQKKIVQEQYIESIVEAPDIQELVDNSMPAQSKSKSNKRTKVDSKFIKENTIRYKFKKRHAR